MNNLREKFRETSWDPSTAREETPKPAGVQAWENYKAQAFQRISQPKNGADAWKAFKINSAIRARQERENSAAITAKRGSGFGSSGRSGAFGMGKPSGPDFNSQEYLAEKERLRTEAAKEFGHNMTDWGQANIRNFAVNPDAPMLAGLTNYLQLLRQSGKGVEYEQFTAREQEAERQKALEAIQGWAAENAAAASAGSVVTSPLSGADYLLNLMETATLGKSLPSSTPGAAETTQALRSGASEDMGGAGQFVYHTGMSAVDSLVAGLLGGGSAGGGIILGLGAASNAANDIKQRGGSDAQALIGGAVSGVLEGVFEKISIGNLEALKDLPDVTLKNLLKNTAKSVLVNASEEAVTEFSNAVFDTVFMGNLSSFRQMVKQYIAANPNASYEDAKRYAARQIAAQVGESALSGGLMGVFFGALGSGSSYRSNQKTGKMIVNADAQQEVLSQAMAFPVSSDTYSMASQLSGKDGGITKAEAGALYRTMAADIEAGIEPAAQQDANSGAVGAPVGGDTGGQVQGVNAPTAAETGAAGVNTDATTEQQERAIKAALAAIPTAEASAEHADAAQAQQDKPRYDPLELIRPDLVRKNNAVSELDTAEKARNLDSDEMRRQIEDAYASGSMTEAEYDDALDALMEQESLEGVNTLDRYNPAMMKTEVNENARGSIPDDGSQRAAGESAGEQAGELAEGTGRDQGGQVQSTRAAGRADAVLRYYESSGSQPVTARAYLGSDRAADEGQVYEVPESVIAGDQELSEIVADAQGRGLTVHLFTGEAKLANGKSAEGMIRGNEVFIRVDSPMWTATQNWEHEKFHGIIRNAPEMVAALYNDLCRKMDRRKLHRTIEIYREAYHGIYDVDENGNPVWNDVSLKRIMEEILADACAGKDTYAQGVEEYAGTARDAASQIEKGSAEVRGPPEGAFTIETLPDGGKYVRADRQVIFGNDPDSWGEQLEDYINGKIRRGQDVKLIADDGDELVLTARTAGKIASPYKGGTRMSDAEYERHVNAGVHIDELAQVSQRGSSTTADENNRHGEDAKYGWNYRTAFFQDFDGQYYRCTISVQMGSDGNAVYNIGAMRKRSDLAVHDSTSGSSAKGGAQRENASSPSNISQDAADVNEKFSAYAGAKKGSVANLAAANASANTPKASVGTTSNTNLPQHQGDVNEQFSASGGEVDTATEAEQDPVQALPAKARRVLENKEWGLTNNLGGALRIPYKERQGKLQGIAREISAEFLRTGAVSDKTLSDIFDNAYRPNEQKLAEEFGVDVEIYRDRIEDDFKAQVNELLAQLRLAARYAEDQATEGAEQKADITLEDLPEMYAGLKAARRTADKAVARNLLTDSDNMKVNSLLRGDIELDALNPLNDNVQGITEVFNAKREYEKIARRIRGWNAQRKKKLDVTANAVLAKAVNIKDKPMGWMYSRETQERNARDIFKDKEAAEAVIETYFAPIHENTAKATRMKIEYRDRVRDLKLSRQVKKGNLVSESHAVQLLGEAEDNIKYLEKNKFAKERGGKSLEDWRGIVQNLYAENPDMDFGKIKNAVKAFREMYDELFVQMNEVRMLNGYEPINYIQGYFPHFQPGEGDSILTQFGKALGIDTSVVALPTDINGLTHNFRPGIQWFGHAQERIGFNTTYDAVEGFDKYIEGIADVIHHTEDIQKLRAFTKSIRNRGSNEGLRKQVENIENNPTLTDLQKHELIENVYRDGRYELKDYVVNLEEYTNILTNKKTQFDRVFERPVGRVVYKLATGLQNRIAANMVAINPASWLTNIVPLAQGASALGRGRLLKGVWDTIVALKYDDGMVAKSDFLTNRKGSDPLVKSYEQGVMPESKVLKTVKTATIATGKATDWLSGGMDFVDGLTAGSLVRARYQQNLARNLSEDAAIKDANEWVAGLMADRSKGAMPTIFSHHNPFSKLFTQFQLEVNNQLSFLFKDLPREQKEKGVAALALALFKYVFWSYIFNDVYEALAGRRPALDPLGMLNEASGDFTGYKIPNFVEAIFDEDARSLKTEKKDGYEAAANLATNVAEELPFVGGLLGGGRLPISSALPDGENLGKALFSGNWTKEKRSATLGNELIDPLLYILPPAGGGQIKKVIQGAQALMEGGSYSVNSKGEKLLQYPVHNDSFGQAGLNAVSAMLFGKSSLPTAREWVESGFDSLTAKETALFDSLRENGAKSEDAYDLIRDVGELETKIEKITEIANSYFDEPLKELAMSNQMSFPQYERYMAARAAGVSTADYAVLLKKISEEAHRQKVENQDGKPTVSQIESELWASDLTPDERRALWDSSYNLSGEYEALLEKFEAETEIGAGSTSQKVVEAVLLADSKLTDAQKRAIWESYGWDNCPW